MHQILPILSTLLIGILHGLEPGHGQTILAGYILGEKVNLREVLRMVSIMILTHFIMLLVLAYLLRFIFKESMPHITETLTWAAPLLMLGFGLYLLYHKRYHPTDNCGNSSEDLHHHREATLTGAVSGLLPCPSVLSPVLLVAVGSSFAHILFYVSAFVIGMGISMTTVLLIFLLSKGKTRLIFEHINHLLRPYSLSAIIIICIALIYLVLKLSGT